MNKERFLARIEDFVSLCRKGHTFAFASTPGGQETLYASCFAVMILHYVHRLETLSQDDKERWIHYINSFWDQETGLYIGPEIVRDEMTSKKHSYEHITMHLCAHVLPALKLLGGKPVGKLTFVHRFLEPDYLNTWLEQRNMQEAWLEGNNLLFVLQFLIYLRDEKLREEAGQALDTIFAWLDRNVDPATGLWGTNQDCSHLAAMCGGYHQLVAYDYEDRPIRYPEKLADTTLSLQHRDGGFNPRGGGGACEDVDAVYILVNRYQQSPYRRDDIIKAVKANLKHLLTMQNQDGGFVSSRKREFSHMGLKKTYSDQNCSNMFSTWFRLHTIALISQIYNNGCLTDFNYQFNVDCSMGYSRCYFGEKHCDSTSLAAGVFNKSISRILSFLLKRRPVPERINSLKRLIRSASHGLSPRDTLRQLFELDNYLYKLESKTAVQFGHGLHTKHRHMQYHLFFIEHLKAGERVLDLGSGNGFLSFKIVSNVENSEVIGVDKNQGNIRYAREHFKHPKLSFQQGDFLRKFPEGKFDAVILSNILEHIRQRVPFLRLISKIVQPKRCIIRVPLFQRDWRVPLKEELGVEYRLDPTHYMEYSQESFLDELDKAGMRAAYMEIKWGEIWCVAYPMDGPAVTSKGSPDD